jgi:hypothetical protein
MKINIARILVLYAFIAGAPRAWADFMATAKVSHVGPVFSYTLFNNEPATSTYYANILSLNIHAPITVIGSPTGWDYSTDNATFIFWFNTDPELPYPHDVAPGTSLSGFVIQSTVSTSSLQFDTITSWDHAADVGGPAFQGSVLAPDTRAVLVPTPEPATLTLVGIGTFGLLGYVLRRRWPPR